MSQVYVEDVEIRSNIGSESVFEYRTGTFKGIVTSKAVITLVWEGNELPLEIIDLFERKGLTYD